MTRETKIGLLVGLAFIIVIGVLLSDHLVNATDAKLAPIADVTREVRSSLQVPGGTNQNNSAIVQPGSVTPTNAIPTKTEIDRSQAGGSAVVEIKPAPIDTANANNPVIITPVIPNDGGSVVSLVPPETGTNEAFAAGNDFVSGPQVPGTGGILPKPTDLAAPLSENGSKGSEYKAVSGDTVARMARKFYGADTNANRQRIIDANASLKANPRKIVVGNTYIIPAKGGSAAAHTTLAGGSTTVPGVTSNTDAGLASERIYTVKQGDNLWKIAKEQCKNSRAADEILKLNRDVLKNGTALKVGMKLKLPAK